MRTGLFMTGEVLSSRFWLRFVIWQHSSLKL